MWANDLLSVDFLDEGTLVQPRRARVNFVGAGVTVSDDPVTGRKIITIPGGGGGGSSLNAPADPADDGKFATALDGNLSYINATEATSRLNPFTSLLKGLVPASGGGTTNFLRADGTWAPIVATPSGSAGGDLTGSYPNPTIANGVVDLANLASDVTAVLAALAGAEYIVGSSSAGLSAERVLTDTTTIVWDFATGGVVRANVPDGSLARAKHANASGISVLGRSTDSAGPLSDIPAPANDRIFARVSNVLGFFQVTGPMIQSGELLTAHHAADQITNALLANMAEARIKGRAAGAGTGDPTDLTGTQVTAVLDLFTTSAKGLAPSSPGGTVSFLRADGSWATPPTAPTGAAGGSLAGTYPNPTIAANAVSNTEAADMAEARIKGRAAGAGAGDPTDLTAAQVKALIATTLAEILAVSNNTGSNDLQINTARLLQLVAGTPTTAGPANAGIEFLREGGGTSSTIGLGTSNILRIRGSDRVSIEGLASLAHIDITSGASAAVNISAGTDGVNIGATGGGRVEINQLGWTRFANAVGHGAMGSTETFDWATTGASWHTGTLSANCTITFNAPEGATDALYLYLTQDATGGRTINWPGTVANAAAVNAALSTAADTWSLIRFFFTGSAYVGTVLGTGLA